MRGTLYLGLCGLLLSAFASYGQDEEEKTKPTFPNGRMVLEDSASPNGRYGILIPTREQAEQEDNYTPENHLADLKAHRVLGVIPDLNYSEHRNRQHVTVEWADDSTWALINYDSRWGMDEMILLEVNGAKFTTKNIGKKINADIHEALTKHKGEGGGNANVRFKVLSKERKVRVRATATDDPKGLREDPHYAVFQGTYDLTAKRWLVSDVRAVPSEVYGVLDSAFDLKPFGNTPFVTTARKEEAYDKFMNEVYSGVRYLLPPEKFAAVKKEQLAWLKQRDAAGSAEERCKLLEARIAALQKLIW